MLDWAGTTARRDALTVVCQHCYSGVGVECINPITGQPLRGFPAHIKRITTSRENQQ